MRRAIAPAAPTDGSADIFSVSAEIERRARGLERARRAWRKAQRELVDPDRDDVRAIIWSVFVWRPRKRVWHQLCTIDAARITLRHIRRVRAAHDVSDASTLDFRSHEMIARHGHPVAAPTRFPSSRPERVPSIEPNQNHAFLQSRRAPLART